MIKEYARVIITAVALLLFAVVFIRGCSYGESRKEQEVTQLTQQVRAMRSEAAGYLRAEEARAEEVARAVAEAEATRARGEQAASEVISLKESLNQAERQTRLAQAHADITCSELLEKTVCDIVPLP